MRLKLFFLCLSLSLVSCKDVLFMLTKSTLLSYAQNVLDRSGESDCVNDLKYVLQEVKDQKLWAMKMVDAIAKPGAGILSGNIREAGSYDECMNLNNRINVTGKYCLSLVTLAENHVDEFDNLKDGESVINFLGLSFNRQNNTKYLKQIPMTWGVCVPASCNTNDLQKISNFSERYFDWMLHFTFDEEFCSVNKDEPLEWKNIFAILYFISAATIVVASSIYDILMQKSNKKPHKLIIAFSGYTNIIKLFGSKAPEGNLAAINGIRVFSLAWVILGHCFMFDMLYPNANAFYFFEWKDDMRNVLIMSAPLSVDSFFAIGGMLVVYIFLDATINNGFEVSVPMFYFHRLLRLTPSLYTCILLYACLLSKLGDGPYWFTVNKIYKSNCVNYWWTSVLYIQNYYNPTDQCVTQSWYLAVDTQIYFMSPLLLFPLLKRPKQALIGVISVLFIIMTYTFVTTFVYEYGSVPIDVTDEYYKYVYMPTHVRCTPWLVGAIWGYFIFTKKNIDVNINKKLQFVIWCTFFIVMSILMMSQVFLSTIPYDRFLAAISNTFTRPLWAMGVCWLIFACVKGYGGWINDFLSMKIFVVLARLNYSMYLLHLIIMIVMVSSRRTTTYFSNLNSYFEFWGYFVFTFVLSVIWTLCFESPIIVLEKTLIKRYKVKDVPKAIENIVNGIANNTIEMELTIHPKE